IVRLFNIQIVENDRLFADPEDATIKVREIKGTRGNILDCNGVLLAYNKLSYSITLEDTGELKTGEEKNKMIHKMIKLIKKYDGRLANDFFIKLDDKGELYFDGDTKEELRFKRDAYSLRSVDALTESQKKASAKEVYEYLKNGTGAKNTTVFNISDEYSLEDSLEIMQVRYYLMLNKFAKYLPITIATNVDEKLVAVIKEYSGELPGVEILTETYRVYDEAEIYAHMMGYTGLISNEKLTELQESGNEDYSVTDQIGKIGLEQYLEEYLHGKKGKKKIKINSNSETEEILNIDEPVAGDNVYLTIDSNLQEASYKLLEKELGGILLAAIKNKKEAGEAESASDIEIPIYDVYYALIDNNIVDITHFTSDDAKTYEKSAYKKYLKAREKDFSKVLSLIDVKSKVTANELYGNVDDKKKKKNAMVEYINRIYQILIENKVLLTSKIKDDDKKLKQYKEGELGFSQFMQYCLENGYIDTEKLSIEGDSFYSTKELYGKLYDYIADVIQNDKEMAKYVYRTMIMSDELTGSEVCIMMLEQGAIEYNEDEINSLKKGAITAYTYVRSKIKSGDITAGMLALDPCSGAVIVTNVNTGDVMAMVTYPSYDNNKLANSIDAKYYKRLLEDNGDVLVNRATQTRTAPGSTFKMISTAAGLEEGVITPSTYITDKVTFDKIDNPPKCHSKSGHGTINCMQAIGYSCNYFYYEVGYRLGSLNGTFDTELGLKKLKEYASKFGFDAKSGVEVSEYEPQISDMDAVRSAIGQGTHAFSPIQIARYGTALANSGTVYDLTLVDKIVDNKGELVLDNSAKVHNQIDFKQSTWNAIHEGMYNVCNANMSGNVRENFKDMPIVVGGKTGTAQQVKTRPSHGLFVSYAPFDQAEICVTAVIQFGYSSHNAADLASNIYKYYYELTDTDVLIDSEVSEADADGTAHD
ncbi:MAG: peptidase, partial [Lachnospiraceae bacterium]|nr:peptidase [Lachnospiraceae bacterium]